MVRNPPGSHTPSLCDLKEKEKKKKKHETKDEKQSRELFFPISGSAQLQEK